MTRRRGSQAVFVVVVVLAGLIWPVVAQAQTRNVLLLYSYEREFAPHTAFASLFRADLGRTFSQPIDFVEISLQAARSSRTAPDESAIDVIRASVSGRNLDLVVTIGGPAAKFAQTFRDRLFPATPTLLADVDQRFIDQARSSQYDTVVAVDHKPAQMLESILQLLPDTTTIVVVIGSSQLEQFWLQEVRRDFRQFEKRVRFVWTNDLTIEELISRCSMLPPHSAIFYGVLTLDAADEPQVEARTLSTLNETANAPVFGLHSSQLGRGILGGPLLSVETLSRNSVSVAVQLLDGVAPSTIHTPIQRAGTPVFDGRELQRWRISQDRLPPDSLVQFREPARWERYRTAVIVTGLLAGVLMIVSAVLMMRLARGRRQESAAAPAQERLGVLREVAGVTMWATGPDGWRTHGEPSSGHPGRSIPILTGLANGETTHVHPNDVSRSLDSYWQALTRREPFQMSYRLRRDDGEYHDVVDIGVPRFVGDRFAGYVGSTIDVSQLTPDREALSSLSQRLMRLHDQQHASIARMLHEDISQRMVELTLRLNRMNDPGDGQVRSAMQQLSDQLSGLASEIVAIPDPMYRRLDLLGFAMAASSLCRELADAHHVDIHFRCEGVPPSVPEQISLSLLRVLEEAVTNAVRHSGSKAVTVSVATVGQEIQLEVADTGIGFNPDAAANNVGLVSIRQRIRMVNGQCDIRSQPGEGTSVRVRVPVPVRGQQSQQTADLRA